MTYTPSGRARFSGGKLSAIIEYAAGDRPASPTPTPIRAKKSVRKLVAIPQAAVITLQNVMLATIRLRREPRSASHANGIPMIV